MPNHVINVLKFKNLQKGQVDILLNNLTTIENNEKYFDFNKIIKMPDSLMLSSGTLTTHAIKYVEMKDKGLHLEEKEKIEKLNEDFIRDLKENKKYIFDNEVFETYRKYNIKNLYDLGKLYLENLEKYGTTDWYDWCISNWGTKWNAYDQRIVKGKTFLKFIFSTAWCIPLPIYEKLITLNIDFEVKYADEDWGSNCGIYSYVNGELNYISKEGDSEWAKRLWYNNEN